ncbi:MAG: hypothetical protein V7636_1330 [Actinomycetota bacterium]|jgi:hypothetical protein
MTARRARGALLVALLVALGIAFIPSDAHAITGDAITIKANTTTEADEPPVPGNDPVTTTASEPPDPETCASLPSCMVVALNVEIPQRNPGDDFVVYVSVSWQSETISDNNVQPVQQNDMDIWIYDDQQMEKAQDSSGYTVIGSSASSDNPEKVKMFEPLLGKYNLVVNNFSGGNTGWHVKAESKVGKFEKPFESLAPTPGSGSTNPNNKPVTTTTPTTIGAATTTTVTVPEGSIIPDDDFEGGKFDPNSAVDDAIAAGQEAQQVSASRKPPSAASPSAIAVIGWMVLLPAAIIAGGFGFVRARRRSRYAPASTSST